MVDDERWSADDMPDMSGKVVVVTGANSGIGREASRQFARHGATVVLACRNMEKGEAAGNDIAADVGGAKLQLLQLDLADLGSVRAFACQFAADHDRLDVLCNNAGLMAIPRRETADGFEMQFGVNHLGHFALTGRLLPMLLETDHSRVVTVSSNAHRFGVIRFEDLNWERTYSRWKAYGQSKLANLLFAYELQRRFDQVGADTISVACHPGLAHSQLAQKGARMRGLKVLAKLSGVFTKTFGQSSAAGALPTLFAAVQPDLEGGEYIGPAGIGEVAGPPEITRSSRDSYDEDTAARLWTVSEDMTGVFYDFEQGD